MSDPHGSADKESQSSPGWTFVSSQGEIMSGDEDSESSESSIEVLSFDGNEVVVQRQLVGSYLVEAEVTEDTTCTDVNSEDKNVSAESAISETQHDSVPDLSAQKPDDSLETVISPDTILETTVERFPDLVQSDLTLSEGSCSRADTSSSTCGVVQEQQVHLPEAAAAAVVCSSESLHSVSCETTVAPRSTDIGEASVEETNEAVADNPVFQVSTENAKEHVIMNITEDVSQSLGDVEAEEPQKVAAGEAINGACCMELLLEGNGNSQSANPVSDVCEDTQRFPIPFSLNFDEECSAHVPLEDAAESSHSSSRHESDADSDFVRLDSDNLEAYVGEDQLNGERIVIPLRLYRSDYTIGPSFSFIRNDVRSDNAASNENPVDNIEQDRDDDTESSTEEGVDDRIESEQSEAGSLSAQNDVGDLSVFADIGDLPLVAGDVPRNYIHRPNNHLSTVLNIIVVLVAILTMGISLGIIMATDMEIEEWQNAYEFQTRKVSQLEILLKGKTKAHDLQLTRVKELEAQIVDLKNSAWTFERRAKNSERAMETLAAYSSLKGGTFGKAMHAILDGMKDYIQCQTESNQLVPVDCHLKLLPYIKNYTALIKNDLPVEEPTNIDLDVDVNTDSHSSGYLQTSSQEMTAEAPGLAAPSDLDSDSLQSQEEEYAHFDTENSDFGCIYDYQESRNHDGVDSSEMSSASHENSGSDEPSEDHSGSSSGHSDQKTAKEPFRASPVTLDIKQLQQSLTREQERALHWQQLYLSERRQKERERDNEEWEDEREREMAERERAQMDQVECLKKLMSANLTTLTQHVVRWNVSVFDDFANLSMLLSGISDLQQAVLDSVQRVWRSAEQVIDSLQGKDPITGGQNFKNTVPSKEDVVEYLGKLLDRIKKVDMPDHDVLVEYLGRMLDHVKHGVEDILNEAFTESVTDTLNNVWQNAEEIIEDYKNHEVHGGRAENKAPDREHLLEYLSKVLNDICHKGDVMHGAHAADDGNVAPEIPEQKGQSDSSFTGPQQETPLGGPHQEEEEPIKHGFWSRRIGKMLKKTGKTVRKLGRKVAGTWGKIKAMWHEKRPSFFKMGNGLASTIKKASSKFARMCKKMSSWFKTTGINEVKINSKYVYKLRKHWQKMVIKDPCEILGKFSYECNAGKKQCQRDLRKISDSFSHLLKIPYVKRDHVLKLNVDDLKGYHKQFKSFQDQWGKSKLLLKTDQNWVDCQLRWWTAAVAASYHGNIDSLGDNKCNNINFSDFYEGHNGIALYLNFNIHGKDKEEKVDCSDNDKNVASGEADDVQSQQSRSSASQHENADGEADVEDDVEDDDNEEREEEQTHKNDEEHNSYIPNSDEAELNETFNDTSDWLQQQAKLQQDLRREKEKARLIFEKAAEANRELYKDWNDVKEANDNGKHYGDWFFEKSKDREHQREEADKSSWIFERASKRREAFHHKWMDNHKKGSKHHNKGAKYSDDWFLRQAEERQKIREEEHKSDWLFERAADRKRSHEDKQSEKFVKHHHERYEHGKHFRHAYGKVSTP